MQRKAVYCRLCSSNGTWKYPLVQSITVKYFALPKRLKMSDMERIGYASFYMSLFMCLYSIVVRIDPSGLPTIRTADAHGETLGWIRFACNMSLIIVLNCSTYLCCIFRILVRLGIVPDFILIVWTDAVVVVRKSRRDSTAICFTFSVIAVRKLSYVLATLAVDCYIANCLIGSRTLMFARQLNVFGR